MRYAGFKIKHFGFQAGADLMRGTPFMMLIVIGDRPQAQVGEYRHRLGIEVYIDRFPRIRWWAIPAWADEPSVVREYRRTMSR